MRKRLRSHEGANAVEFALVLPILVILIFGIFTVGEAYHTKLGMSAGVRDGARYGATLPLQLSGTDIQDAWFQEVRDRVVAASSNELFADGHLGTVLCIAYVEKTWIDLDDDGIEDGGEANTKTESMTYDASGSTSGSTECFSDNIPGPPANGTNARVQVRAERPATLNIVMAPALNLTLSTTSVNAFEPAPVHG